MLTDKYGADNKMVEEIVKELSSCLQEKKEELFSLNKIITCDLDCWINKDYEFISSYLKGYIVNNSHSLQAYLKPKGRILIILSYNEPFILSIVPILNALVAGNDVLLRPSKRNLEFVKKIWIESGLADKYNLKLSILENCSYEDLDEYIKISKAVYFFGSYEKAKHIALECARNFVEFLPEIEAADCKIIKIDKIGEFDINKDVLSTLDQSFSHSGQSCQRIHGILVQRKIIDAYLNKLTQIFNNKENLEYFDKEIKFNEESLDNLLDNIEKAAPEKVYSHSIKGPFLIINPLRSSDFVKNAYFLPTLWLIPFDDETDVLEFLNNRKFYLGLNIVTDDEDFAHKIVKDTNFSRYTINSVHTDIRDFEGWGGNWPTGFGGYKEWLYHFSNPYIEIR